MNNAQEEELAAGLALSGCRGCTVVPRGEELQGSSSVFTGDEAEYKQSQSCVGGCSQWGSVRKCCLDCSDFLRDVEHGHELKMSIG